MQHRHCRIWRSRRYLLKRLSQSTEPKVELEFVLPANGSYKGNEHGSLMCGDYDIYAVLSEYLHACLCLI